MAGKKRKKRTGHKKSVQRNSPVNKSSDDLFRKAVQHHQSGEFQQAEEIYKRILEADPKHSDALHLSGLLFHQKGRTDIAEEMIQEALRLNPRRSNYHNNLGILYQEKGELDKAIECYKNALNIKPDFADAYNNMGFALQDQKKLDEAIACYQKAIQLKPDYSDAYNNIGTALKDSGRNDESLSCYQKAIQLKPDYVEAYNNMGSALKDQGRFDEAISCYKKASEIRPDYVEAYNNMGSAFRDQGKFNEAAACYRKALQIKPNHADVYNNLGILLKDQGRFKEAAAAYQRCLQLKPENPLVWVNLGNAFQDQARPDQAIACYKKALEIRPDYVIAYDNMRNAFNYQGRVEEAIACCEKRLQISHDAGVEIRKALMLPVIYESREQIQYYRNNVIREIEALKAKGLTLTDPHKQVGSTNFYLAYHGLNDKDIQKQIASFYLRVCPWLGEGREGRGEGREVRGERQEPRGKRKEEASDSARHQISEITPHASRITLGIISMHLYNLHQQTVGKLTRGIIEKLSREKFYVKLFRFPGGENRLIKSINQGANQVIDLPTDLKKARDIIAGHSLDILFYPDIGMDAMTYFLAFSRLAPVQCVTWGHPVTTGIPNMDYFISSELMEPRGAADHYSERLVLLKRLPVYYYPPEIPLERPGPEKFGLPKGYNLYVCPQAPFKFHPDFDAALGEILRRDPKGLLILIEGQNFEHWAKLLLNRFGKRFPDAADRVRFLKAMPTRDFLSLLMAADALIEPPYFGGGNTTYESFACGVPIVTWPGPFMRGRVTLGCYKQMGVTDCVANDAQSYIELACGLANDKSWKEEVMRKIRDNAHAIFEDMEAIHELERFFEQAASHLP